MNTGLHSVKVYVPHVCLMAPSGLLLGWQDKDNGICCITAVLHNHSHRHSHSSHTHTHTHTHSDGSFEVDKPELVQNRIGHLIEVVGVLINTEQSDKESSKNGIHPSVDFIKWDWILIEKRDARIPNCVLMSRRLNSWEEKDVTVIVVDGSSLMNSAYLMDRAYKFVQKEDCQQKHCVDEVTTSLLQYKECKSKIQECLSIEDDRILTDSMESVRRNFFLSTVHMFMQVIIIFMANFIHMGSLLVQTRVCKLHLCQKLSDIPAVACQLKHRFLGLRETLRIQNGRPKQILRSVDLLCQYAFDVAVGVTVLVLLARDDRIQSLAALIMAWADKVTTSLTVLLQWLMGAPAGLKLNKQLGQLMGKFFLYHIYLWTGYLEVLRPVLERVLWIISLSGVCGLSIQLALMRDLVSMMTLHIYCFYVYAARLYSLQVYGLASLWRLFRGKKWNVLRQRVDSASFDIDQLFIGTLFFTILLFLLPTIAMYYIVFVVLRLVVLTFHGVVHRLVHLINILPVASIAARLVYPDVVTGTVKVSVAKRVEGRPLYLTMMTQPASLATIFRTFTEGQVTESADTWGIFVKKLVTGRLVYPWIEQSKEKAD